MRAARTDANHTAVVRALRLDDRPMWACARCGVAKIATVHQMRQTYCSIACVAEAYKAKFAGEANPNFKGAGWHECEVCKCRFHDYNKSRKFCSISCRDAEKPKKQVVKPETPVRQTKPKTPKEPRESRSEERKCVTCQNVFRAYKSQAKRYCSYKCHLDDGGAFRAGIAASKAKMKYGTKKDANHNEIFDKLRELCPAVYDLSMHGHGVPDGLAWILEEWRLFEVKNPSTAYGKRGLNAVQKKWLSQWKGGPVYMIYTTEEAEKFAKGELSSIKAECPQ